MAARIFGERFLARGKPAWWDIQGTRTFDPAVQMNATQAVEAAGLMYDIVKAPQFAVISGGPFDGDVLDVPGRYSLVRLPAHDRPQAAVVGSCGDDYEFLQNVEMARLLDPIAQHYPVESVGALDEGETVFFCFDAKESKIAGEHYRFYFVFSDTRDGGTKAKMMFTPVRIECWNTLVLGTRQAVVTVPVAHNRSHRDMVGWQLKMLEDMAKTQTESIAALEAMAKVALTIEQVDAVLAATYPKPRVPAKAGMLGALEEDAEAGNEAAQNLLDAANSALKVHEFYLNRADRFRAGALELFGKFNDDRTHKKLAGTAYALFQAVCEVADYREGTGAIGQSTLFGDRAREKTRAWAALAPIVGVK